MSIQERLFIHKYQPVYFDDFGMESDVKQILETLIQMNNLNVLLSGNMASGKTSLLNSIVREYYKDKTTNSRVYNENILYINSLKEQGINYYRTDVKTFCQTCSTIKGKKKIVILDDIDLINEQSQQVFRNCIDKYSHNVHFISSCSNIQKVIESLQSRVIIVKIKPIRKDTIVALLNKIKFKLLGEPVTLALAHSLCSNISFCSFEEYTRLIKERNLPSAIKLIYEIYDKGYSVMDILDNYFLFVKQTDMLAEDEKYNIIPYICKYITVFHDIHEDEIELALFTNNLFQSTFGKS